MFTNIKTLLNIKNNDEQDIQINDTCKLYVIEYDNDNHSCIQLTDNKLQLFDKLIANNNIIIRKSQYKLVKSDENINTMIFDSICITTNSTNDKVIKDAIIYDLKQHPFITIASKPTYPSSAILLMNINKKINGNVNGGMHSKLPKKTPISINVVGINSNNSKTSMKSNKLVNGNLNMNDLCLFKPYQMIQQQTRNINRNMSNSRTIIISVVDINHNVIAFILLNSNDTNNIQIITIINTSTALNKSNINNIININELSNKNNKNNIKYALDKYDTNKHINKNRKNNSNNNHQFTLHFIICIVYLIILYTSLQCTPVMDITQYKTDCIGIHKMCFSDIV